MTTLDTFRTRLTFYLVALGLVFSTFAHARTVEVKLPSGLMASAEYQAGEPGKSAAIIVHGFLQTRTFPTVTGVAGTLTEAGHTVLTPTLSLGTPLRNKSLACEAVHTHSLEQDVAEIAFWTEWLADQGYESIILIGHSFGSLQILTYLSQNPHPAVKKAITISLTDVERRQDAAARARLAEDIQKRITNADNGLMEVEFGHCKKYVSPPQPLLSYMQITRNSILAMLKMARVPIDAIMGGGDDRMGADWSDKLAEQGIQVQVIPDANHFFDNQFEFDLQDAVLQGMPSASSES